MAHTATSVRALIEAQRAELRPLRFGHDLDLARCVIEPKRVRARVGADSGPTIEVWIVVDECPGDRAGGYSIVWDEARDEFGLAVTDREGSSLVLTTYATLADALDAM